MLLPRSQRLRSLFRELRRRRVFRAAVVYVVVSFGALQGADVLVPALHLPEWTMTLLVVLALVGLPVALSLAWVYDVVPDRAGGWLRLEETPDAGATGIGAAAVVPGGDPGRDRRSATEMQPASATETQPASAATRQPASATSPSVAVLPFLDMSASPENEIFADGVTEDVIAHLSRVRSLKVISRSSMMPFRKRDRSLREVGAQVGATALLDGSVRRIGDRVRIVAQLVDAETDRHLWAETYDRRLTDIFAIQTDVALHIAAALEAELSVEEQSRIRQEPTGSLAAYGLYLKGRQWFIHFTPDALHRAIDYFGRAVAEDPGYALAHVGIAMAYAELVESGALPSHDGRPRAMEAASKALELAPTLGESHCAMAHLKSLWEFDWEGAEAGFRQAIELCPNAADAHDLYGRMCAALGRYEEALALQRRARELDPLAHRLDIATTLLRAGRYTEAEEEAAHAVEFEPEHDPGAHATLGWALILQGRTVDGLASLERAVTLSLRTTQWLAQLGQARAMTGDPDGARAILRELEARGRSGYLARYHLAYIYTGLGDHDRAVELLERAFDEREGAIHGIKGSFLFAPLRDHPRFQGMLARMGLS